MRTKCCLAKKICTKTVATCPNCGAESPKELKFGKDLRKKFRDDFRVRGAKCVSCDSLADTVDHIVPISRGGADALSNYQPMCSRCNGRKGDKTVTANIIPNNSTT